MVYETREWEIDSYSKKKLLDVFDENLGAESLTLIGSKWKVMKVL